MTTAALAVVEEPVAPDLVLPPGFDRVGETIKIEQDFQKPSGEPERWRDDDSSKPTRPGDDPRKGEGATPSPGTDRRGPTHVVAERPGRIGLPGAVALPPRNGAGELDTKSTRALKDEDLIACTRCQLRGHVAGEPGRCLGLDGAGQGLGQSPWMTGEGQ